MRTWAILPIGVALLAACAAQAPVAAPALLTVDQPQPSGPAFDRLQSAALLEQAEIAEAGRHWGDAEALYRRSALAWPDTISAWDGLSRTAAARRDEPEAQAAAFAGDRMRLYPGDGLTGQREVNVALRRYVADQAAEPTDPPQQVAYARRLVDYYTARYAARGVYMPGPEYFDIDAKNASAVLITAAGVAGYAASLFIGARAK
jgi:hypothetical protein